MGLPSLDSFSTAARQGVWRGDALGAADAQVLSSGHAALDEQLPGGGWPVGAMTEVLQAAPEAHVWQLLLPVLARAVESRGGPVALIGAPHEPFGPSLAAAGLPVESLLSIGAKAASAPARPLAGQRGHAGQSVGSQHLWACEQALRCADIAAVLAWLPQARVGDLRRLQLAAAQHEGLLFVFRPQSVAQSASPARLRLQVMSAEAGQMDVHILKRRGPPMASPLTLPARSERMAALLAASQLRRKRRQQQLAVPVEALQGATVIRIQFGSASHAMDRIAVAA